MIPYAQSILPAGDVQLLMRIRQALEALPDVDLGVNEEGEEITLSCHILSRAVAKVFSLKCRSGFYYPGFSHSWLVTASNNVIDVLPPGIVGGPILADGSPYSPSIKQYIRRDVRKISDGNFSQPSFRRSVRRIIRELKNK